MPIENNGWEFHIVRKSEQRRSSDGKRRTVGQYQIFHDGVKQTGAGLSGTVAETRGPGANKPAANNRRVEEGRYPLFTQDGSKYVTIGFKDSESTSAKPKPGLELKETGQRSEILIHPGQGFLASIGCINPCTSLPNAAETIRLRAEPQTGYCHHQRSEGLCWWFFPNKEWQKDSESFCCHRRRAAIPRLSVVGA